MTFKELISKEDWDKVQEHFLEKEKESLQW